MRPTFFHRIEWTALALVGIATVSFAVAMSWSAAAACAVGGGLGIGNFIALRYVMGRAVDLESGDIQAPWALLLGAKFIVLAAVIYTLILVVGLAAGPFAVGISAIFGAFVIETLRGTPSSPANRRGAELNPEEV